METCTEGGELLGTSSHGSMLSSALHLRWTGVYGVILLLAISTDAALSLNGYDMVMGAFRENMGKCRDGIGDGMALGCATLTTNVGRFYQKSCKMPVASADTFADAHVILSCHSFILHVMGEGHGRRAGGLRKAMAATRTYREKGAADEWP